jgi:hypothetical protein
MPPDSRQTFSRHSGAGTQSNCESPTEVVVGARGAASKLKPLDRVEVRLEPPTVPVDEPSEAEAVAVASGASQAVSARVAVPADHDSCESAQRV